MSALGEATNNVKLHITGPGEPGSSIAEFARDLSALRHAPISVNGNFSLVGPIN